MQHDRLVDVLRHWRDIFFGCVSARHRSRLLSSWPRAPTPAWHTCSGRAPSAQIAHRGTSATEALPGGALVGQFEETCAQRGAQQHHLTAALITMSRSLAHSMEASPWPHVSSCRRLPPRSRWRAAGQSRTSRPGHSDTSRLDRRIERLERRCPHRETFQLTRQKRVTRRAAWSADSKLGDQMQGKVAPATVREHLELAGHAQQGAEGTPASSALWSAPTGGCWEPRLAALMV